MTSISGSDLSEVLDALRTGGKLGALAVYRAKTGASLGEAMSFVDNLASDSQACVDSSTLLPDAIPAVRSALAVGDKLAAIRLYREATGISAAAAVRLIGTLGGQRAFRGDPALLDAALRACLGPDRKMMTTAAQVRDWPEQDRILAAEKANALINTAFELANAVRDGRIDDSEAMQQLRERCSGFGEASYRMALSDGYRSSL